MDIHCDNCGHLLYRLIGGRYEHFTRAYIPYAFPYSTRLCYADGCECNSPVPKAGF